MSFYSTKNITQKMPGEMQNPQIDGLCERIAIQTFRVLDSCVVQKTYPQETVCIHPLPKEMEEPFIFISGCQVGTHAHVTNVRLDRIPNHCNFSRVRCDVIIPVQICYKDAKDKCCVSYSNIVCCVDVIMCVPEDGIIPISIKALASALLINGKYKEHGCFEVEACINCIIQLGTDAIVTVPAFGYTDIPMAVTFNDNACEKYFNKKLYPHN